LETNLATFQSRQSGGVKFVSPLAREVRWNSAIPLPGFWQRRLERLWPTLSVLRLVGPTSLIEIAEGGALSPHLT
jgi:hypothetical protein